MLTGVCTQWGRHVRVLLLLREGRPWPRERHVQPVPHVGSLCPGLLLLEGRSRPRERQLRSVPHVDRMGRVL